MITELLSFSGDGWYPRVAPDCSAVTFGNKDIKVWMANGSGLLAIAPGRQARWIQNDVVTFTQEVSPISFRRFECRVPLVQITDVTNGQNTVIPGSGNIGFDASQGHWCSCIEAGRLTIDGAPIAGRFRHCFQQSGETWTTENDAQVVQFVGTRRGATFPLPFNGNEQRLSPNALFTMGYFWNVSAVKEGTSGVLDITATPWRREKPGLAVNGWYWSSTEGPNGRLCIFGQHGFGPVDEAVIIEGFGADWFDVRYDIDTASFLVAANDDTGHLAIWRVDENTPTQSLKAWGGAKSSPSASRSPSASPSPSPSHSPSASPSHGEEHMNEDYRPVATEDPELTKLSNKLDVKYKSPSDQGGLGRGPTETFVDPLGRARWMRDYYIHRDTGDSPDVAWKKVNKAINDIVGLPGDIDPNPQ